MGEACWCWERRRPRLPALPIVASVGRTAGVPAPHCLSWPGLLTQQAGTPALPVRKGLENCTDSDLALMRLYFFTTRTPR
jgi:hypothetical protein